MKGGFELISKYHVPFIITEFTPNSLENYGFTPKAFVKMFIDNGYKMSIQDFFPNEYDTLETFVTQPQVYLFFIYKDYAK